MMTGTFEIVYLLYALLLWKPKVENLGVMKAAIHYKGDCYKLSVDNNVKGEIKYLFGQPTNICHRFLLPLGFRMMTVNA